MNGPSKILDRKWREKDHNIHKKKLSEVRSTIREQQGYTYQMPAKNAKREAIQESKFAIKDFDIISKKINSFSLSVC